MAKVVFISGILYFVHCLIEHNIIRLFLSLEEKSNRYLKLVGLYLTMYKF